MTRPRAGLASPTPPCDDAAPQGIVRRTLTEVRHASATNWFKDRPLGSSACRRRQLLIARLPRPIRRMLWWVGLNVEGRLRVRMYGTFGVSVYSGLGAASLHPPTVGTSTITYGVID